jgi:hypothetical protein
MEWIFALYCSIKGKNEQSRFKLNSEALLHNKAMKADLIRLLKKIFRVHRWRLAIKLRKTLEE